MDFGVNLSDVGNDLGTAVGAVSTGGLNLVAGGLNSAIQGAPPPDPNTQFSPVDPNLIAQRQGIADNANAFQQNLDQYKQGQIDQASEQNRQSLAGQLQQNTTNANSRGLLYSGIKQGGDAQARAGAAQNQASQVAGINRSADQQNTQMQAQNVQAGLGLQQVQNRRAQDVYGLGLQQQQQRMGLLGALGKAGGSITGAAIGKYGTYAQGPAPGQPVEEDDDPIVNGKNGYRGRQSNLPVEE